MMQPTIDPTTDFIRLSRRAERGLQMMGVQGGTAICRRVTLDAAAGMKPIPAPTETHFLASAVIDGRDVVCLCLKFEGSKRSDRQATVVIRAIFEPAEAAQMIAANKGLAPFAEHIITGANSAKYLYQAD